MANIMATLGCELVGGEGGEFILNSPDLSETPETEEGISLMMQSLGRYYVRYFNKRHKRTGTLWEGRFKASIVDSDRYFLVGGL